MIYNYWSRKNPENVLLFSFSSILMLQVKVNYTNHQPNLPSPIVLPQWRRKRRRRKRSGEEEKISLHGHQLLHLTASERHQSDAGVEDSLALYLRHEQGGDLGLHQAPDSSQVNRPFSYSQMWASQKQVSRRWGEYEIGGERKFVASQKSPTNTDLKKHLGGWCGPIRGNILWEEFL